MAASFDVANRILLIELKTGLRLAIPQEDLQDIYRAYPKNLADVEMIPTGTALHFEKAMEGVRVDSVRQGIMAARSGWLDWRSGGGSASRAG